MTPRRAALLLALTSLATAPGLAAPWSPLGGTEEALLPAEAALRVLTPVWENGELVVGLEAAPGCYLYRKSLRIEALEPPALALAMPELPAGEMLDDPHFGRTAIWRDRVEVRMKAPAAPRRLRIHYQGCAENKLCYPPQTQILDVQILE